MVATLAPGSPAVDGPWAELREKGSVENSAEKLSLSVPTSTRRPFRLESFIVSGVSDVRISSP